MDDELEDRVLYQIYLSHIKILSRFAVGVPLNTAPLTFVWKVLRLYVLRPDVLILSVLFLTVCLYLNNLNLWSRALFSRINVNLDKTLNPRSALSEFIKTSGSNVDGDKESWELKEENVAVYAVRGRRAKMEDRFVIHEDINNTGVSVFAIFDGHGGEFAANYARDHLMPSLNNKLVEMKNFLRQTSEDKYEPKVQIPEGKKEKKETATKVPSFRKTVSTTDENFNKMKGVTDPELLEKLNALPRPITREVKSGKEARKVEKIPLASYLDNSKSSGINYGKIITDEVLAADRLIIEAAKKTMDVAGTTALIALLEGNHFVVANVGDSRGVMCDHRGNAIPLSFDHKPQQIKERHRIQDAGGYIAFNGVWRVMGILATSRALGDYPLKENNFVVADPDVLTFDLGFHRPLFGVLASDGLWDQFTNEEVVSYIKERLNEPHFGAKSITLEAYYRGSLDNITVMVINFKDRKWSSYSSKKMT